MFGMAQKHRTIEAATIYEDEKIMAYENTLRVQVARWEAASAAFDTRLAMPPCEDHEKAVQQLSQSLTKEAALVTKMKERLVRLRADRDARR